MRKSDELSNPKSCINKAGNHEMVFVLLSRDTAAPFAIAAWIESRLTLGLNEPNDPQITEARDVLRNMMSEGAMYAPSEPVVNIPSPYSIATERRYDGLTKYVTRWSYEELEKEIARLNREVDTYKKYVEPDKEIERLQSKLDATQRALLAAYRLGPYEPNDAVQMALKDQGK